MAAKTKLPADDMVQAIQNDLTKIEADLQTVLKADQPGFSKQMLGLLEQAKGAWGQLQGALNVQAKQERVLSDFNRTADLYSAKRRRADDVAILTNRALLLLTTVHQHEETIAEEATDLKEQLNGYITEAGKIDKSFYEQLNVLGKDVEETLTSELKAPAGRLEVFGQTVFPSNLTSALVRARHKIIRAMEE